MDTAVLRWQPVFVHEVEQPVATLREAVIDGLLAGPQVVPLDETPAERLADRIMEAVERRDLTVMDRSAVAAWHSVIESQLVPLLRLHGKGTGVCDVRGHHVLVLVEVPGWAYDVLVCEDCEHATQVERSTEDGVKP